MTTRGSANSLCEAETSFEGPPWVVREWSSDRHGAEYSYDVCHAAQTLPLSLPKPAVTDLHHALETLQAPPTPQHVLFYVNPGQFTILEWGKRT